jgi:hypothetical protein
VAEDEARSFGGIEQPNEDSPLDNMLSYLRAVENSHWYYTPDWWVGEEYYLMLLVEKVDLISLFGPVARDYHIPYANSRGWSSILQRNEIITLSQSAEEKGLTPVLLYCGDHDPHGLVISDFLRKNIEDLAQATKYWGDELIIDRFGLNYDFIEEQGLSWIENLETGSGRRADINDPNVASYVERFGWRKCEANALVVNPDAGRQLFREAIEKYLGQDAIDRFEYKEQQVKEYLDEFKEETECGDIFQQIKDLASQFEKDAPWEPEEEI